MRRLLIVAALLFSWQANVEAAGQKTSLPPKPSEEQVQQELIKEQNLQLHGIEGTLNKVTDAIKDAHQPPPTIKASEIISWILVGVGWSVTAYGGSSAQEFSAK